MSSVEQANSATAAICEVAELGDEAMELMLPDQKPPDFVALLVDRKLYPDAVRFLAHALPKREAVWWGWMSARRVAGENPKPKIKAALEATEKWIAQPNEDNRRAAHAAAQQAKFDTAAGCAGLGAFFSGGSLAPPDVAPVPPGEYLTAKAITGAVNFAAMTGDPRESPEKFKAYVAQGL